MTPLAPALAAGVRARQGERTTGPLVYSSKPPSRRSGADASDRRLGAEFRQFVLEEWHERTTGGFDAGVGLPKCRELRHLQSGVSAGIDALEWLEIHVHVERETVVARAAADAQADAGDLLSRNIDTRRVLAALG